MAYEYDSDGIVIFEMIKGTRDYELVHETQHMLRYRIEEDGPRGHRILTARWNYAIEERVIEIARGACTLKDARSFCQFFNVELLVAAFTSESRGDVIIPWTKFTSKGTRIKKVKIKIIKPRTTLTEKTPFRAHLDDGTVVEFLSGDEKAAKYRAYRIAKDKSTIVTSLEPVLTA